MESILLTGYSGFLGKIIYRKLVNNYDISTLSRNFSDYNTSLENSIPKFNHKFNLVIHAAGKAHDISKVISTIDPFFDVNVVGTKNLLIGLSKIGLPSHFVYISSVSVYGIISGTEINEDQPLLANDSYGLSKIRAEELVMNWCIENNIICTILRLPLIVGENPPGNLGSMIRALKKGYYFNINGGKSKKSMVLADDIANFIIKAAMVGGIYNLTDGYHPSFSELSNHISKQIGKNTPINIPIWVAKIMAVLGDVIGDKSPINSNKVKKIISTLTFDDSKAKKSFGWAPTPVLMGFKLNNSKK